MSRPSSGPSDFTHLVGKAVFDTRFAERLTENPNSALREIGIEPTEDILEAIKDVDLESIRELAAALGDDRGIV